MLANSTASSGHTAVAPHPGHQRLFHFRPASGPCPDFSSLLARFAPISLGEMAGVSLLKRTEVKYVMHERQLYDVLTGLVPHYRVLEVNRVRLNLYHTLYFDTPDFALYHAHHAGARNRYKVRSRSYVDSRLSFLEVKHKVSDDKTVKSRLQTNDLVTRLTVETGEFVAAHAALEQETLEPKLWNEYLRITLVSRYQPERLTLDVNLRFGWGETAVALPSIAIAEVKQDQRPTQSDFVRQMHIRHIRPNGFSKYCLGVAMLYPMVKHNGFKPKLRLVEKLMQEESYVQ